MVTMVIGLGSMGKRRSRLLKRTEGVSVIVGVDASSSRREEAGRLYGIPVFSNVDEACSSHRVDCAFVCTPPLTHSSVINDALKRGLHVFTEINLISDGYQENMALAEEKGLCLFLSSTLLYRKEISYISDSVKASGKNINYIYHVGQYLPDWHPWESYKDFFVNEKRTNACRELFAIELPWLLHTFGDILSLQVQKGNNTSLELGYPDNYLVLCTHKTGAKGLLAIDIISRKAVRNLEVFGENIFIEWDGSPTGLARLDLETKKLEPVVLYEQIDKMGQYSSTIIENAYEEEILAFFRSINGEIPVYGFNDDLRVLSIIDKIEE